MDRIYEYFKVVKKSHSYFLLSCFLSIVISISITDSSNVNKAINEVDAFIKFSKHQNESYLELVNSVLNEKDKIILKAISDSFYRINRNYKNFNYGWNSNYMYPGLFPSYMSNKHYNIQSFQQNLAFLESLGKDEIIFVYPEINDFEKKLNSFLENLEQDSPKYIYFKTLQYNYESNNLTIPMSVSYKYDREKDIKSETKEESLIVKIESRNLKNTWLDVLLKNNLINEFVKIENKGEYNIFPYLKLFWQNIKDIKPTNAIEGLMEIRSNIPPRHTISILGFGVDLSPMKYYGQIVIVLLFLHFYLHLSHVEKKRPNKDIIEYFPWISLYESKIAIKITWTITFILPSVSIVSIFLGFYTDNSSNNWSSLIISIITIGFVIWIGILINRILVKLRD